MAIAKGLKDSMWSEARVEDAVKPSEATHHSSVERVDKAMEVTQLADRLTRKIAVPTTKRITGSNSNKQIEIAIKEAPTCAPTLQAPSH